MIESSSGHHARFPKTPVFIGYPAYSVGFSPDSIPTLSHSICTKNTLFATLFRQISVKGSVMAYIRKRGRAYYVEIRKLGIEKNATFDSKTEAAKWAADTEVLIVAGKASGVPDITFGKLLERYQDEVSSTKRGEKWEKTRIGLIQRDDLAKVKLAELDARHVSEWRDRRLKSVSAASVRREWNLLSAACSVAVDEWRWLPTHPMKGVKRPTAPQSRDRRISEKEIEALLYALGYDGNVPSTITSRVGAAFLFAIETGMRAGEIAGLTWDRVHLDQSKIHLRAIDCKNKKKRDVSLSPEAIRILRQFNGTGSVFGLSTTQIDALFRKAKAKALIEDLHFHDCRHEAITRLARRLEVLELARMVGITDLRVLMVYFNATASETAQKLI